jgi:V8-like Glu-specific endopeptidase
VRARLIAAIVAVVAVLPAGATAVAGSHAMSAASRQSRTSDVAIAGASVFMWSKHGGQDTGSGCTLAFSVRSVSTGKKGALTAGHCVETLNGGPAYNVQQTESLPHDATAPGDLLGKVTGRNYVMGEDGDSAFVGLVSGRNARPLVFTGGSASRAAMPVAGVMAPETGMQVCYSGAATGEHCGFTIVGGSQDVSFKSGRRHVTIGNEWRATGQDCTSRKGDSGSPVYVDNGGTAYAVGILSGGQVKQGQCPFYFTPVKLALKIFGLTLITSKPGATS